MLLQSSCTCFPLLYCCFGTLSICVRINDDDDDDDDKVSEVLVCNKLEFSVQFP